ARRAAVAVRLVAVLAVLQGVDHAVPALGEEEGPRGTGTRGEGAGELLAVARAAVHEVRAQSGDLPAGGELARAGIHGAGGGYLVRRPTENKAAHPVQPGSRLHEGEGDGNPREEAHVVAAQIERRRAWRRPESHQQSREDEPADRPMLHRGSPVTPDGLCPAKEPVSPAASRRQSTHPCVGGPRLT